jgi:RNA polymerase sigma-70 factor (ECF subfamily)
MGEKSGKKNDRNADQSSFHDTLNDDALMVAICVGDVSALEVIYDRYSRLIFPLCRRILKDEWAAEEVLQDIFLEIWRLPGRFNPARGSLIVYLTRLARSRAIDRWRKDRKGQHESSTDSHLSPLATSASNSKDEPPRLVELYEQLDRMRAALRKMPELHRMPIELAFLDGLSHTEIAKALSIPLGTIKARIRNGLLHLRDAFQSPAEEDNGSPDARAGDYGCCAAHAG